MGGADGNAGVSTLGSEKLFDEIGGSIGDGRMIVEIGGAVDENVEPEDLLEGFGGGQDGVEGGQGIEGSDAGGVLGVGEGDIGGDLAGAGEFAVLGGQLSGDEDEGAGADGGTIGTGGAGDVGEGQADLC